MEAGDEEFRDRNDFQSDWKAANSTKDIVIHAGARRMPHFSRVLRARSGDFRSSAAEELGRPRNCLRPVALLELLSRPAVTGIVAADLLLPAHDLLHLRRVSRSGHACLFEFTALAPHEGFFQFVG